MTVTYNRERYHVRTATDCYLLCDYLARGWYGVARVTFGVDGEEDRPCLISISSEDQHAN